jgi:anti-sigma-K factor RskA
MNGHDELINLLGAYALDAVDDDERRAIDEHLQGCADCRAEVAQHLEVAAALGATTVSAAPDDLWAAILGHIDDGPTEVPGTPALPGLADRRVVPAPVPAPDEGAGAGGNVVPLDPRRRPTGWIVGLAAAAAIIVVLAAGLVQLSRQNEDLTEQLAAKPPAASIDDLAAAATADSSNRVLELTSETGDATAKAVVTPSGEGYLVSTTLDPLPADRTYQLWNIGDAGAVSLGVLGNDPGAVAFHVQGPVTTLAITAERAGGVPSPENIPLVTSTA